MRTIVTGCGGRVGLRVALAALKAEHEVLGVDVVLLSDDNARVLDHPKFTFAVADLRDFNCIMKLFKGFDAVINLAGIPTPTDFLVDAHNTNVVISWNVLRAAAELGINRVALASSVNAVKGVFSVAPSFAYFPIDELHPALPDEPYGLSKAIGELQANGIVQRYPKLRVASIRLHWSIPSRSIAQNQPSERARNDLWGWVQEDSGADAFLLAVTAPEGAWFGHEVFYVVAPEIADPRLDSGKLRQEYWPDVPVKGNNDICGVTGFYDCSKARTILGWVHTSDDTNTTTSVSDDSKWY